MKTNFTPSLDHANDVAIQEDGKIVAAGEAEGAEPINPKFALARYSPDGTLDPSFSGNGKVQTDLTAGRDEARGVAIQSDGRIVLAGVADDTAPGDPAFALARYLAA